MNSDTRLKRLRFRAWHRGTREADLLLGGFFDAHAAGWTATDCAWFETLLEEQDVDIIAWALGREPAPPRFAGPQLVQLCALGYVPVTQ